MRNRLLPFGIIFLITVGILTGCAGSGKTSLESESALPGSTPALIPGGSDSPSDSPSNSPEEASDGEFISVGDVPAGETGDMVVRNGVPSAEEIMTRIEKGGAFLSIVRNQEETATYEIERFPYIDSATYSSLVSGSALRKTKLEALNLDAALHGRGTEQHYFAVTDGQTIETFEKKVLSLEFKPTKDTVPQGLSTEYVFTDENGSTASYTIFVDGLVLKTVSGKEYLAAKRVDTGTAAYFFGISLGYSHFYDGPETMYCVDDPGSSRFMILRGGEKYILDGERSSAFLTFLCGENSTSFEINTSRGGSGNDTGEELFRFFPLSKSEGSETGFTDPGDPDNWYRFCEDGMVIRKLNSLTCVYGEIISVLYVNIFQTVSGRFDPSGALAIIAAE